MQDVIATAIEEGDLMCDPAEEASVCRGPDDVIAQGDDAKINVYWRIENGGGGESLIERS